MLKGMWKKLTVLMLCISLSCAGVVTCLAESTTEESADEAAIRERSIELLFSKKDLKKPEYRFAFNRILMNADALGDLGRALLMTALTVRSED